MKDKHTVVDVTVRLRTPESLSLLDRGHRVRGPLVQRRKGRGHVDRW